MMKAFFAKYGTAAIAAAAVLVLGGAYWYIRSSAAPSFPSVTAEKGNVIASVDETADVEAENNVDLSFPAAGPIANVYIKEGENVAAGQVLATLDQSSLQAGVEQANAALAAAQAKLDSLQNGTRPEQIQADQTAVANARASLGASVESAYTSADDAIRNEADNLFTNPRSINPILVITVPDSQTQINIQSQRVTIEGTLTAWYNAMSAPGADPAALSNTADSAMRQVKSYLDALAIAVNAATPNGAVTASVLSGYKANVVAARTEAVAAITALTTAESTYNSAQSTLTLAQAGSTAQDIEAQKAAVQQSQAAALAAQVALDHASIKAPFAGTVNNLTAKVGLVVSPGVPVLSLTNSNGLKIVTYVSQSDVAQIAQGDKANMTLDAFGTGKTFPATVTTIDTSPTQVNGTQAYKVTLHFANPDASIRDGMTGSVHIVSAEHDDVVVIPARLVVSDGNNHFVLVAGPNGTERRQVETGLSGDDGMTEITSGISVGDHLINF